jgi:TraM recognition site of TraD and TraG
MFTSNTLTRVFCVFVSYSGNVLPLSSAFVCMTLSGLFILSASVFIKHLSSVAMQAPIISDLISVLPQGWQRLETTQAYLIYTAWLCAWLLQARCIKLCFPLLFETEFINNGKLWLSWSLFFKNRTKHGFKIAGMPVGIDELKTSILVTGVTGSSKTAGVLMPALAQLLSTYNKEIFDSNHDDTYQKLGAFIPEVKGDLVDGCIYLAHMAGRVVSRDIIIVSPACQIPVVRFLDEKSNYWYVSARGGSGSSDAAELLPYISYEHVDLNYSSSISSAIFETKSDFDAVSDVLGSVIITMGSLKPRFIGWRWRGNKLIRVSHTIRWNQAELLNDNCDKPILAEAPKTLKINGLIFIDNQVHYNLVDPRLPPAEAAERLARLAVMAKAHTNKGDNDYFYEQGKKLVTACITLHRALRKTPCTATDIVKLITYEGVLDTSLLELENILSLESTIESRSRIPLEALLAYFRNEWLHMLSDVKTATIIISTISSTFDIFLHDPNLSETFCQPSTFSFEDIIQKGKIICLVPGDKYEQLGRVLGTACKLDFQSTMLSRTSRPELNSNRLVVYFADECHKYVIGGSSTSGDPYFMNLSRSNNIVNICATQSYAWLVDVLGRDTANVYISAFGVQFWLQQTDPETCKRAADICGTVIQKDLVEDQNLDLAGFWSVLESGKELVLNHHTKSRKIERYSSEEFAQLDVGDIVAYNKGRKGKIAKVMRGVAKYHFCTQKPDGVTEVRNRVREYYRELIENKTYEQGKAEQWSRLISS